MSMSTQTMLPTDSTASALAASGKQSLPPKPATNVLKTALQTIRHAYDAFIARKIPEVLKAFSDNCIMDPHIPSTYGSKVPIRQPRKGKLEVEKYFNDLSKYVKYELFDVEQMTTGSYMNTSGHVAPRIIVSVKLCLLVLNTGKKCHFIEAHQFDMSEDGTLIMAEYHHSDTQLLLDAFTPSNNLMNTTLLTDTTLSNNLLDKVQNNLILLFDAYTRQEIPTVLKYFTEDASWDLQSLIPQSMAIPTTSFKAGMGIDFIKLFFTEILPNNMKVHKFEIQSINTGIRNFYYRGQTQLVPSTLSLMNMTWESVNTGKRLESPNQLFEFIWNPQGDQVIAFNHRLDSMAYSQLFDNDKKSDEKLNNWRTEMKA